MSPRKLATAMFCAAAAFVGSAASAAVPDAERAALIALYDATGGPQWISSTGWKGAAGTECSWSGVECDEAQSTVVSIILRENRLTRTVPGSIGDLSNLQNLELSGNALRGSLPDAFSRLSKLKYLELSYNQFSGPLPSWLPSLTSLVAFAATSNAFSGAIPPEIGRMTTLDGIWIGGNQLSGEIPPQLGQLVNLKQLDLSENSFVGTIPPELGDLSQLDTLRLSANMLTGTIPSSLGRLRDLQVLELMGNSLTGNIPPELGNDQALRELWLGANTLSGEIPAALFTLTGLTTLHLDDNRLTGTLSSDIGHLTNLTDFTVQSNQLTGSIPPQLAAARGLQYLGMAANQFSGTIPDALQTLTSLVSLDLGWNKLSGPLPVWLSTFAHLDTLALGGNELTGTIPESITTLGALVYFDLASNRLSGEIPSNIGRLQNLQYLQLSANDLTGTIPDSVWTLHNLLELHLNDLFVSGPLSTHVGDLASLELLDVEDNALTGTIPAEIGNLSSLQFLFLSANRFTGPIPREVGQLKHLVSIRVWANNLSGPVPPELAGITTLADRQSDFSYNALYTTDAMLLDFLNRKQENNFETTQTVKSTNVRVTSTTDRSAVLEWSVIPYVDDPGGYQIQATPAGASAATVITTTASKEVSSEIVRGLQPATTYSFTVATVTYPNGWQRNVVFSDPAAAVTATTGARVLAPAEVVVTSEPKGLVQIDTVPQNDDRFTLTNFGDTATVITLTRADGDFFEILPATFTLAGGAIQAVTVKSLPQPPGTYYGWVVVSGEGAAEDLGASVSLLATSAPIGSVRAEASSSRVEVTGVPGSDSIGTVGFKNSGTATLTGILASDVPWLVPKNETVTIGPGELYYLSFTVARSHRPEANGALTGTLSLVYVAGSIASSLRWTDLAAGSSSVSVTTVTVVDVAKPQVAPGTIPAIGTGEVAYFISGLASMKRPFGSAVSDIGLVNAFGAKTISDLRLYFTPAASVQSSVASIGAVAGNQSLSLVNVVTNVYSAATGVGSLQVRTAQWQKLVVTAKLLSLGGAGTYAGDIPVFRSDHSAAADGQINLPGLRQGGTVHSMIYLQETSGATAGAGAHIDFFDAGGTNVGQRDDSVGAFGVNEITDAVPQGAVTAVVTNRAGSAGRLTAYARMLDDASGESWSVVDWSRYYGFTQTEPARLPLVQSNAQAPPSRWRGSRHATATTTATRSTELTLFNPTTSESRVRIRYTADGTSAEKEVTLKAHQTLTISDVAVFLSAAASTTATVVLTPISGRMAATSRISAAVPGGSSYGMAVPVIGAASGLRAGQSQIFSGLDDSTAATVAARTPGTYRTSYGFVESSGAPASVRVTLLLSDGHSLVSTIVSREVTLAAGQLTVLNDMVRSIVGETRETSYPDLHNLQLAIDVSSSTGAVVPFVIVTDNATGDTLLRLE
jgi:Leucine-rich repeat (LRR) protein